MPNSFLKDPEAVLDYVFDWTVWLEDSETIFTETVTAQTGITLDSSAVQDGTVVCWLSGGTAGSTYRVECKITTSAGRTDERTIRVRVIER